MTVRSMLLPVAKKSHQRALFTKNAAVTAAPRNAADSSHGAGPGQRALYSNNVDYPLRMNETFQFSNSHQIGSNPLIHASTMSHCLSAAATISWQRMAMAGKTCHFIFEGLNDSHRDSFSVFTLNTSRVSTLDINRNSATEWKEPKSQPTRSITASHASGRDMLAKFEGYLKYYLPDCGLYLFQRVCNKMTTNYHTAFHSATTQDSG